MSNDKLALIIAMTMSKSRKSEFLEHTFRYFSGSVYCICTLCFFC